MRLTLRAARPFTRAHRADAAAHVALAYPALAVLARPFRLTSEVWRLSVASPSGMFLDDLANASVAFLAYSVLRRAPAAARAGARGRPGALPAPRAATRAGRGAAAALPLQHAERHHRAGALRAGAGRAHADHPRLDQLNLYLDLQRVRFGDRLDVRVAVDADVLPAYVPGMILQPLVENAITHGLTPKLTAGTLRISAMRDGDSVVLRVRDDAVGLPTGGARERIGVGNTRERLRAPYGEACSYTRAPLPEGGAMSEIRIPFRTAPTRTAEIPIGIMTPALPRSAEPMGVE